MSLQPMKKTKTKQKHCDEVCCPTERCLVCVCTCESLPMGHQSWQIDKRASVFSQFVIKSAPFIKSCYGLKKTQSISHKFSTRLFVTIAAHFSRLTFRLNFLVATFTFKSKSTSCRGCQLCLPSNRHRKRCRGSFYAN